LNKLKKIMKESGAVKIPVAYMEIRWLSKLRCLEAVVSSSQALLEYFGDEDLKGKL